MTYRSLLAFAWRDLVRRPWQATLMFLGMVLGIGVMVSIDVATVSARRGFDLSTQATVGSATHQVRGGPNGIPEEVYARIRKEAGWRASAPIVEGVVQSLGGRGHPLRILGIDPLADTAVRPTFRSDTWYRSGFSRFFLDSESVIIHSGLAEREGIAPGDRLRLAVGDRTLEVFVLGVWRPAAGAPDEALEDLVWMDLAAAQELFAMVGRLTRIDLVADPEDVSRIAALLPAGVQIAPASEHGAAIRQLSEAFALNLTALSLLALVVGMFLIYNSTMFRVVQRRPALATLAVLGARPGQVRSLILMEAIGVAALGALAGIPLGWWMAQSAVKLVTQTINDLYFTLSVREAVLLPESALRAVVLGIGAAALAAAGPAREASRAAPGSVFHRSEFERGAHRWIGRAAAGGAGLSCLGAVALFLARRSLTFSLGGVFAVLVGLALLAPAASMGILAGLGRAFQRGTSPLGWAVRSVQRSLSRSSVALAALMVALAVTIGLGVMIANFRATVDEWLGLTLRADLYVASPLGSGSRPQGDLSPDWADRLASLPGVARVEPFRSVVVASEFGPVALSVVDGRRARDAGLYRFAQGEARDVWPAVRSGAVIVSEAFATHHGLGADAKELTLITDLGPRPFPLAAVFYDYTTDQGSVMLIHEVYQRFWEDRSLSSLGLFLEPGSDLEEMAARVRRELHGSGLQVVSHGALRQRALEIFDRSFAVTSALRILSVVVAAVGVLSALMALQLERSRENATLRALGMSSWQLGRQTLMETSLMGVLAGLLSLPVGVLLAWILTQIINQRSFGWTIPWYPGIEPMATAMVLSLIASLAAGLYPWLRLVHTPIAEGLRSE